MLGDSIFPVPTPQDKYAEDRRIWNTLFDLAITDLAAAEKDGIPLPGSHDRFFPIVLGNKGDWSYLATCLLHILHVEILHLIFWDISDLYSLWDRYRYRLIYINILHAHLYKAFENLLMHIQGGVCQPGEIIPPSPKRGQGCRRWASWWGWRWRGWNMPSVLMRSGHRLGGPVTSLVCWSMFFKCFSKAFLVPVV